MSRSIYLRIAYCTETCCWLTSGPKKKFPAHLKEQPLYISTVEENQEAANLRTQENSILRDRKWKGPHTTGEKTNKNNPDTDNPAAETF